MVEFLKLFIDLYCHCFINFVTVIGKERNLKIFQLITFVLALD